MQTFIVILITLLVERFFDFSHLRQWNWYAACEQAAQQKVPNASPYLMLGVAVLPPVLALAFLQYCLSGIVYGFPWLLIQLIVLMYCFGPKNLWADAFASINSLTKKDAASASETLKATFNVKPDQPELLQQQLINQIVIAANERVFAVVFWFGLLGLPGALLYRLISVSTQSSAGAQISSAAHTAQDALDWIPARIFTFLFALGGNFTRVLTCWRQRLWLGLDGNDILISECGIAAIAGDGERFSGDGSMERSAVSLLDRAFIIVLVVSLMLAFAP